MLTSVVIKTQAHHTAEEFHVTVEYMFLMDTSPWTSQLKKQMVMRNTRKMTATSFIMKKVTVVLRGSDQNFIYTSAYSQNWGGVRSM